MDWRLLIFLVLFFSIVFILVFLKVIDEPKNKGGFSGSDEYPWPRRGWPFL